jgi:hypothetical protein
VAGEMGRAREKSAEAFIIAVIVGIMIIVRFVVIVVSQKYLRLWRCAEKIFRNLQFYLKEAPRPHHVPTVRQLEI